MTEAKEDRRIRRTKKLLKQGLAEMMNEKDFKDITVKDITEKADLNRGTFYLHYSDTYDLLRKVEDEILQDFQDMIDKYAQNIDIENPTLLPVLSPIAGYVIENIDICKSLFNNRASSDFTEKFQQLISRNGASFINKQYPGASIENYEYFFSFITCGTVGIIKKWFESTPMKPKDEIVVMTAKIIRAAANSILKA